MFKKIAFTLAEVLIVLGIVGVVAEMTIPTLISNVQNQQYVAELKKSYSNINQVLVKMSADAGCTGDLKCTGLFSASSTDKTWGDQFAQYFKIAKNCGTISDTSISGCFPDTVYISYDRTSPNSGFDSWWYRIITTDGMVMMTHDYSNDCADSGISNHITNNLTQVCGIILIDVNGLKSPNAMGRDIYEFYISNGRGPILYPVNGIDDSSGWGPWINADGSYHTCYATTPVGYGCAARIIDQGWQMNY